MLTVLIGFAAFVAGVVIGWLIGRVPTPDEAPHVAPAVSAPPPAQPVEVAVPEIAPAAPVVQTRPEAPEPPPAPKRRPRETTVLVCGVGSGAPEEETPANVLRCLSDLQRILAGIIGDEGGSIDRFAGDRVIAVFSAKGKRTDHAGHALEAAQRIANNVDAVSRRLGHPLTIGVGVHSGSLPVGEDGRVDETAIGDAIDVAARLEALATEAKVPVIVSDEVLQRAEDEASAFEAIGEVVLGEGEGPRRVFALKSREGALQLNLIDLSATAHLSH